MTEAVPAADDDATPRHDPFAGPEWHASSSGTPDAPDATVPRAKVSRRRRSRRRLRRRRRIGLIMVLLGGVLLLAALWIVVTGLLARSQLNQVRSDVRALRVHLAAGDLAAARASAADLAHHASRAHELTTGPAWAIAAAIPDGGEPLRTFRGLTSAFDRVAHDALPRLLTASQGLDPARLRGSDGSINLGPIAAAEPGLARASGSMQAAAAAVGDLPAHTWLSSVDGARADTFAQLTSLARAVRSADLAARIAPSMLGADGPRNYFLAFESEAELRGSGGFPGAFAIVRADQGQLRFTRFEPDSTLTGVHSGLDLGSAYRQLYGGAGPTNVYADSNVSPHFPYAARIWVAMWRNFSGQRLDGAVAVDPTALRYLLRVTGPVSLGDGTQMGAANVVSLTQRDVYAKFPRTKSAARKRYQLRIARAISRELINGKASAEALLRAAGKAAGQRRLMAWSADPKVEADLEQTALGGGVPRTSRPFVGLSLNNAAANKLDYYLDASLRWQRSGCGSTREVTATITLHNGSPPQVPRYVLGQTGRPGLPQQPGDNETLVGYIATRGSQLTGVEIDGAPSAAQVSSALGHPVFTIDLSTKRGQTRNIVLHLVEPAGQGPPTVLRQPMVHPLRVSIADASC